MRLWIVLASLLSFSLFATAQDEPPAVVEDAEAELEEELPEFELVDPTDRRPEPGAGYEWLRAEGYDPVVCPFRGQIDYKPGEIECGLIKVPENREVPGSRTIELHFVRIAARGEDHEGEEVEIRDDPVIYLTGGPGVQATGYVERLKDHRLPARRDLYILEQRGIGYSGEFCSFFEDRNPADWIRDNFEDAQTAFMDAARACIENARAQGVDVTAYHTFENARDIKALRLALGLENWNVWGISYGSVLGQAYMKVDPEGIRAAVIDAIVPLDLHELMRIPHWHTRNLDRLFSACQAQPDCAREFSGLEQRYRSAIASLTEQPVALEVPESERYPDGRAYLFQDMLAGLPFGLLYEQSNHPALPAIIDGLTRVAEERDESFFRAVALADISEPWGVSWGMAISVRCLDGYMDRWAEAAPEDFREYPTLARAFGSLRMIEQAPAFCREVGLVPRYPAGFEPVQTDLPVVVANGALDPVTPTPLAEYIMPGFENGRLAEFPHAGHGPTRSVECGGDFLNSFYDDPTAPLDTECVEDGVEAAEYIAPYYRTKAALKGVIMAEEDKSGLRRHAIWAGGSAAMSVVGFLVLGLAWLARRLNFVRLDGAGGSRLLVFLAAASGVAYAGGLGAAAYVTFEVTEAMLLFGMVPWAEWFAWLGPAAGLLGVLGIFQTLRNLAFIPLATLIGLVLTAIGAISLSVCGYVWDLWPI